MLTGKLKVVAAPFGEGVRLETTSDGRSPKGMGSNLAVKFVTAAGAWSAFCMILFRRTSPEMCENAEPKRIVTMS